MSVLSLVGRFLSRQAGGGIALVNERRHRRGVSALAPAPDAGRAAPPWSGDPRWYPQDFPPRQRNRLTPLVDGERYFPALYEALGAAKHYVYIAGWFLTPYMPLLRGSDEELRRSRLLELLDELSTRLPVRILIWEGAGAILRPTVKTTNRTLELVVEQRRGDLRCYLDPTAPPAHCHHQKTVVIDGQVAFVGGMDLTTLQGDRWDSSVHPLRLGPNWHDAQLRIEGEAVADVETNFRQRWEAVTGDRALPHRDPEPAPDWQTPVQIVRTIPAGFYPFAPDGIYGIHHAYVQAIRQARRFIYFENQYLWNRALLAELIAALRRPRDEPLRLVIVLPALAEAGKFDNDRHVQTLRAAADESGSHVAVYSLYTSGAAVGEAPFSYRPIYVHAKIAVIDDEWCTLGSANLNHRGLMTDSEINAAFADRALARELRVMLWAEHLGMTPDDVARADPVDLIDNVWPRSADDSADVMAAGREPLHNNVHHYAIGRSPGDLLLEELQALTFDR